MRARAPIARATAAGALAAFVVAGALSGCSGADPDAEPSPALATETGPAARTRGASAGDAAAATALAVAVAAATDHPGGIMTIEPPTPRLRGAAATPYAWSTATTIPSREDERRTRVAIALGTATMVASTFGAQSTAGPVAKGTPRRRPTPMLPDGRRLELRATPVVEWEEDVSPDGLWTARSAHASVTEEDGALVATDPFGDLLFIGFHLLHRNGGLITESEILEEDMMGVFGRSLLAWSGDGRFAFVETATYSDHCTTAKGSRDLVAVDLATGESRYLLDQLGEPVYDPHANAIAYTVSTWPSWRIEVLRLNDMSTFASESFVANEITNLVWLPAEPEPGQRPPPSRVAFTARYHGSCGADASAVLVADLETGELDVLQAARPGIHVMYVDPERPDQPPRIEEIDWRTRLPVER